MIHPWASFTAKDRMTTSRPHHSLQPIRSPWLIAGRLLIAAVFLAEADLDARPSQGGWTIRQIVHLIVDGDDIWKLCIKMAMGNEDGEFALEWYWALPQQTWAERWAYAKRSPDVSLALFRAERAHVVQLLESAPEVWERSVTLRTPKGEWSGFLLDLWCKCKRTTFSITSSGFMLFWLNGVARDQTVTILQRPVVQAEIASPGRV